METSAVHVGICEQNPVCKWGRHIQHRNKNSEQNVSPFPKGTDCFKYFYEGAAGFVTYLRGHISMFNYIKGKFSLDLVLLVSHPSSVTVNHGMTHMDRNKHTGPIYKE